MSQVRVANAQDATFTGYATAVVEKGEAKIETFGVADRANSVRYGEQTIQPVGSVSKLIVGLALAKAVELKLVDLDADINSYLDFQVTNPNLTVKEKITLRHLASHTSGIRDDEKFYRQAYVAGTKPDRTLGEYLKDYFTPGAKLYGKSNFGRAKPGEEYTYSNVGAALAAYVIECAARQSFATFSETNILRPLGMNDSAWAFDPAKSARYAALYGTKDEPIGPYVLVTYPDGGLRTTVRDLAKLLTALIDAKSGNPPAVLTPSSWEIFFRPYFAENTKVKNINPKEPNIGLFVVYAKSGEIGHTGSDEGASCFLFFDAVRKRGRVFMANEDLTESNLKKFREIWAAL